MPYTDFKDFLELIQILNKTNSEFGIASTLHHYLAYKLSILESNIYLINSSGLLQNFYENQTSSTIEKIKSRLEEEGIIDWCFLKEKITFIPNIYDESVAARTFIIIIPVIVDKVNVGVFISISEKDQSDYSVIEVEEMEALGIHATIRMDSIRKVTEIDNMNKRLRFLNNEIIRSTEKSSIGDIATGIASEIQSPIKIIEANINLLDSGFQNRERRLQIIKEQFAKIIKINDKLNSLTKDPEDDDEKIEKIFLNDLLNEIILLTESQLRKDGIIIEKETSNETFITVGIKNQIEHLLLSMILYSKDMVQDGGKINLSISKKNRKNLITISDNGIGFTDEQIKLIFDPAFELKSGADRISGLYIQQQIAKKFKGKIEIISELTKGTTYKLFLPVAAK